MQMLDTKEIEQDIAMLEQKQAEMLYYIQDWKDLCKLLRDKGYVLETSSKGIGWVMPVGSISYSETVGKKIQ